MNGCNKIEISIIFNVMVGNNYKGYKSNGFLWIWYKMRFRMKIDYVNNGIVIIRILFFIYI